MLNGEGCVVANDSDPRRCHSLVHQLQRVGTTNVLVVCDNAQSLDFQGNQFDRVLCDVPCSGDGTLRKSPVAGSDWHPKRGGGLHGVQRAILRRGLELLRAGGIAVYSTCSMNPIENEAVVNSVLLELDGAAEIVDCQQTLSLLKGHPG
jgi:16S rRNA C967 or C1407 C5-methylase (RsmB/RsmF family)